MSTGPVWLDLYGLGEVRDRIVSLFDFAYAFPLAWYASLRFGSMRRTSVKSEIAFAGLSSLK